MLPSGSIAAQGFTEELERGVDCNVICELTVILFVNGVEDAGRRLGSPVPALEEFAAQ